MTAILFGGATCTYFDDKKNSGLKAKQHKVVEIQRDKEKTANIIIDFPLRSMEAVVNALGVMKKEICKTGLFV